MAPIKPQETVGGVDCAERGEEAVWARGVLQEEGVGGLEEDFDAVERGDEGFSL